MRNAKVCAAGLLCAVLLIPVSAGSSQWTAPVPQTKPQLASLDAEGVKTGISNISPAGRPKAVSVKTSPWADAFAAWQGGDYKTAHEIFADFAKTRAANEWSRAGAAFWAARCADRMHERRLAKGYLQLAAQHPRTFYGQLAAQILRTDTDLPMGKYTMLPDRLRRDVKGDAALIHAIILQESRFNSRAKSAMGARGLMQLMPATARHIDAGFKGADSLYNEAYNIRLGSQYVQRLAGLPSVQGQPHLLLAAYNGGPANLDKWLARMPVETRQDPLLTIESYPSSETRAFVERVMANMWVYERILNDRTSPSLKSLAETF